VGVSANPPGDAFEIGFCCTHIEKIVRGVAVGNCIGGGVVVGLALERRDSLVQVVDYS